MDKPQTEAELLKEEGLTEAMKELDSADNHSGTQKAFEHIKNEGHPYREVSGLSGVPKLISELSSDMAKIDWLWEGYIAKGHLTFFSALWKVGKSTLISHLLKSFHTGEYFAGQQVKPCKTLILSEESEAIWARRREDLGLSGDIYLSCRPIKIKLTYQQWLEFIKKNLLFCEKKGIDLLILDTISTFWPVRDEGNNPELDAAIIPLTAFLEKYIAVLLIHHFRKSGGTEGTATRGGGGLGSRADILLEFTRLEAENISSTQRVIRSYSRFDETPPELVIELLSGKFVARGTRSDVSKEAKSRNVLLILTEAKQPMTITEIVDAWDTETSGSKPVARTMRRYVEGLLVDGRVKQAGTKMVGKTEAPTYCLHNVGQDTTSSNSVSAVNNTGQNSLFPYRKFDISASLTEVPAETSEASAHSNSEEKMEISFACPVCRGNNFWQRPDGDWVCAACHPTINRSENKQLELGGRKA